MRCELAADAPPIVREAACEQFGDRLELELRASGEATPVVGRSGSLQGALVFVPAEPLHANTQYTARARLVTPGESAGESYNLVFHTGNQKLPPLVSDHAPRVDVEWYEAPVLTCDRGKLVGDQALAHEAPSICPGEFSHYSDCRASGTQRALRYRVRSGTLQGGDERLAYRMELLLTDGTPGRFTLPSSHVPVLEEPSDGTDHRLWTHRLVHVSAGTSGEIAVDAPISSEDADVLCIRVRISDVAGNLINEESECQRRTELIASAGSVREEEAKHSTTNCAVAQRPWHGAQALCYLAGCLGLLLVARRRVAPRAASSTR